MASIRNKKYTLYLDESQTYKFNPQTRKNENYHFCMAGIIIADDEYPRLEDSVNELKRNIWAEIPNPEEIILHQMLIANSEKGRLRYNEHSEYAKFSQKRERKKFYAELKKVFDTNNITIVGSSLCEDDLKKYYNVSNRNKQDSSLVTMQLLLENYCHFLCVNNGVGRVIYESRELFENERLRDRYYHMKLMGSMYMNKIAAEKHLLGIDFISKEQNCAGLQIADFVPLGFARDQAGMPQCGNNIFSTLKYHRYDGNQNLKDRFGIKYMP